MQLLFINEEFCHFLFTRPLMIRKEIIENRIWKMEVHFSRSVECSSLQHTRPPYPSTTLRIYSNSCPLSGWYHPTISSSVVPFSSRPQSFPASGSLQMSQLFTSSGQSIEVSASTSVPPMNTQDWSPLGWTGSPCSPRDSQESSPTPQFKIINLGIT